MNFTSFGDLFHILGALQDVHIILGLCRSLVFSSRGQKVQKNQAEMKKNHSPSEFLERKIYLFPVTF